MQICPNCLGRSEIEGPRSVAPGFRRWKECPTCDAAGEVPDAKAGWIRCDNCDGWGLVGPLIGQFTCGECNGYGFVSPPRAPAGVRDGSIDGRVVD
jgi:DnaJ-class molecular chaperone